VKEVEEGNANVEEWCDADERERKQQKYSFKKQKKTMFIKPFNFNSTSHRTNTKHRS